MRDLNVDEIDVVSGGEYAPGGHGWDTIFMSQGTYAGIVLDAVIEWYTTGVMPHVPPPPPTVNPYWEFGASLGIGFGLYGDGENIGISFNAGVGLYGTLGASADPDAINNVGNNSAFGSLPDFSFPKAFTIDKNGNVSIDPLRFNFGLMGRETDKLQKN